MQCLSYSPNRRCCLWHAQEEGIKLNSTYVLTHTCNRSHFCLSPLPPSPSLPVPPPSCSSHSLLSLPFHHPFSLYCPSPGHHCCLSLSLALPLLPPPSFFPTPPSSSFLLPFSSFLLLLLLLPSASNRLPRSSTILPSGRLSRHRGRNDSLSTPSDKHFKSNSSHK